MRAMIEGKVVFGKLEVEYRVFVVTWYNPRKDPDEIREVLHGRATCRKI
jgi:hypothetical protein